MSTDTDAAFGRRVAAAQGFDSNDPGIDYAAYGKAAQYAMGKGRGVPDPEKFRVRARLQPSMSARRVSEAVYREIPPRRVVRIGGFEIGRNEAPPAANRPRRPRRHGERTTAGLFRRAPLHFHKH